MVNGKLAPSVEAKESNVSLLHHIITPLAADKAQLLSAALAATSLHHQILVPGHLGADKALLKVRMDDSGSLRSSGTRANSPSACLRRPRGEVRL